MGHEDHLFSLCMHVNAFNAKRIPWVCMVEHKKRKTKSFTSFHHDEYLETIVALLWALKTLLNISSAWLVAGNFITPLG